MFVLETKLSNPKYLTTHGRSVLPTFYHLKGHYHLLIADCYSMFIAVENLWNSKSETMINKCKNVFSQFGIPKELITKNGP